LLHYYEYPCQHFGPVEKSMSFFSLQHWSCVVFGEITLYMEFVNGNLL